MTVLVIAKRCGQQLEPLQAAVNALVPSPHCPMVVLLSGCTGLLDRLCVQLAILSYHLCTLA